MKKEFVKSVATAVLGLALVSSCSSAKKEEKAAEVTKQEAHKCGGEKNTCKAAKEAKTEKVKATKNVEK